MKGISKSLFASQARVRSAMADAAQASMDTLGYARGDAAAARDAEAAASAFRRGDDGACDPDASLVLVLEHAVGFDEPCLCLAARVVSADGRLKGARARTLAARRDDSYSVRTRVVSHNDRVEEDGVRANTHTDCKEATSRGDDSESSRGAHVFARRRDLRLRAAPGDALFVEAYGADDTFTSHAFGKKTSSAWATKCVARGAVSLEHALCSERAARGESVRVPLHRALFGNEEDARMVYVSVRFLVPTSGRVDAPPPPDSLLDTDSFDTDSSLGPLIDLDTGYAPAGARERYPRGTLGVARSPPSSESRFRFPKRAKRVFFVRHGESRWNEAQREMHLSAMAKFDHPLNTRGAGQATRAGAEAARHQRSASTRSDASDADPFDASASANATDAPRRGFVPAGHGGDASRLSTNHLAWWRSFGDATRCFSSPLTRAAQTAALFLFASGKTAKAAEDPAARKDEPFVVLSRSLREVKSTMGSLDTIGIERGADGILRRAAEKLRDACHGGVPDAAYADAAVAAMRAETDAGDAFGRWWTSRDDVDSREQMDERVDDFFETLRLEASDAVIVVGHSLWFQHAVRRLCARAGSRAFAEREKDAARALTSEKIGNCACVGLALAFDAATGEASLEDAAFLLGGGEAE